MTRNLSTDRFGLTAPRFVCWAAAVLLLSAWPGCCWPGRKPCDACAAGGCPTYCPPQGECFGYYATYWRRWPGDCHLWHPEMLPLVVEPVSATLPAEEMPAGSILPSVPTPATPPAAPAPSEPPPIIVEPKGVAPQPPQSMTAPPVELGPDSLSGRRVAYPPDGGVVPARYPASDLRRLDAARLSRIGTTIR